MDEIVIVDYGLGNLASIQNMLRRVGVRSIIAKDPAGIEKAAKLILPGVGAFDRGISNLHDYGLWDVLNQKVLVQKTPVLGICLGMQLMTKSSEEGTLPGLGWVDAQTIRFQMTDPNQFKIPHMGWNHVRCKIKSPLVNDPNESMRFYFVHSYRVALNNSDEELFSTCYENEFTSAFQRDNVFGVQFHPEKSHMYGKRLLGKFAELPAFDSMTSGTH